MGTDYRMFLKRLGRVISTKRQELKITQTELGDRLGLDQGNVSRVEAGKQAMDLEILYRLPPALGIQLSDLLLEVELLDEANRIAWDVSRTAKRLTLLAKQDPRRYDAIRVLVENSHTRKD